MYENAVPVFEMKNKLSYFLHKVDNGEDIYISVRGKPAYIIQSIENYEEQLKSAPKEKTLFEAAAELRKKYGLTEEDFKEDITDYFDSLRDHNYFGSEESDHLFDEV